MQFPIISDGMIQTSSLNSKRCVTFVKVKREGSVLFWEEMWEMISNNNNNNNRKIKNHQKWWECYY